jgi:hypothetical protein
MHGHAVVANKKECSHPSSLIERGLGGSDKQVDPPISATSVKSVVYPDLRFQINSLHHRELNGRSKMTIIACGDSSKDKPCPYFLVKLQPIPTNKKLMNDRASSTPLVPAKLNSN